MTLKFGKFKGQQLQDTPKWYQHWLNNQEWFNSNKKELYGVYYTATKHAKLFANLKDELIEKFENFEAGKEFCSNQNMCGYIDDLHSGYVLRPIISNN